mgnify:FL=1
MMIRFTRTLFTVVTIAVLASGCGDPPSEPEQELRAWVAAGVEAAENEKRRVLVNMISPSYADARGYDRERIDDVLRVYFFRQDRISLLPRIEEITVYDTTAARIVMTVGMA